MGFIFSISLAQIGEKSVNSMIYALFKFCNYLKLFLNKGGVGHYN